MAEQNEKLEDVQVVEVEELDDEALAGYAGGGMRDQVYVTPTTEIGGETRKNM